MPGNHAIVLTLRVFTDRNSRLIAILYEWRETLRQIDIGAYRLQSRDFEQARCRGTGRGGTAYERAGIEITRGDHPIEWGNDALVALRCSIRFPCGERLEHSRVIGVGVLPWNHLLLPQRLVASVGYCGYLIAGLRVAHLLIRFRRLDSCHELTSFDDSAFVDEHSFHITVDFGIDRRFVISMNLAGKRNFARGSLLLQSCY